MDASSAAHPRQRTNASYPRAPSRSSVSTTNTRMTSQSANSSSSHVATSPQLSHSHSAHRFYHQNSCPAPSGSPRAARGPTPVLSREGSAEMIRQPAMSSFLQEKLLRERRTDSERMSIASRSQTDMSASLDLGRAAQDSKLGDTDSRRPGSSAGSEPTKKQGPGLKEIEQVWAPFIINFAAYPPSILTPVCRLFQPFTSRILI